jgi:paired amphipathic helix protein Sin3a
MGGASMMMRGHPGGSSMMGGGSMQMSQMGGGGGGGARGAGNMQMGMGMGQQGYGAARGGEPSMSMKQVGAKVATNARRRAGGQVDIQPGMSREAMQAAANAQALNRVHTVSAERRFFDQVKDILSSTSRDSWTEFVKCLELFSNDYISKKDMFKLVQDLFGPTNQSLFEEFKALLFRRSAYDSSASDMWYAIPLSEIDFSQCLKCTPSYRALPKDYPKAVCSDRDAMEQSVLNDSWVSIPIGSEESYSFKHMRKNQYEEALFKCEDDRFEIDMLIDTNMSTIRMLEPLSEEIQHIKQLEETESGGPKFNFQLEKRHLSPIHINCISRIYGEYSGEILELLRKNPVGAVPVVLKRLKQKDLEWRKARQDMNKMWKEVLATNSERSFDHRSFYHRVQDKRSYNARHLVADIKTIGCNPEATTPPELVPLGVVCPVPPSHPMLALCGQDVLPCHLLMTFENEGRGVHRDVYRIFCHAAELSGMNNIDKERISALWRDLVRVFFDFPIHFMYNASQGVSSEPAHSHYAPSANKGMAAPDVAPNWPIGSSVLTFYGVGTVTGYRAEDSMHSVRLPFGIAYMRPSCILGSEELSVPAMAAIGVTKDANGRDVILNGLNTNAPKGEPLVKQPQQLFFGTQMCYVFLRLYHTIYSRLLSAKRLARANAEAESEKETGSLNVPLHKFDEPEDDPIASPRSRAAGRQSVSNRSDAYSCLLSQIMAIVDGTIDATKFEDNCRQLLGNKSFFLYTIDKILQQALKCLQAMANDEIITKLVGIFLYHRSRNIKSGTLPSLYRKHVAHCLSNTLEEVYRLQYVTRAVGDTRGNSAVICQFLGTLSFDEEADGAYSAADVSTPRPSQTPRAMGSAGSDGQTNSTIKAPQLVLPDAEEDDEEEDEEDEGEDGDSENNPELDGLEDGRRMGSSVAMDIAVANDGEDDGGEDDEDDGMDNEDEAGAKENDDGDEGSEEGVEDEESRRGGGIRCRSAGDRGRAAPGRTSRGARGSTEANGGADKAMAYMQMLPAGFNSQVRFAI